MLHGDGLVAETDVFDHAVGGDEGILEDDADVAAQFALPELSD